MSRGPSPPHVLVLVGDCLRAADATPETLPGLAGRDAVRFAHAHAPGTWTLPAHASLYAGTTPVEHGITRRGDELPADRAVLPAAARAAGYRTAIFSENPTFSRATGFGHGIDYVDDGIHRKPLRSGFAADALVDRVGPREALELLRAVAGRPERLRNLLNLGYGLVDELRPDDPTAYPHHGERVLAHLDGYLDARGDEPVWAVSNLLDPHNPHHAPPPAGATALGLSVPDAERRALAAANDDRRHVLADAALPAPARERFDSWAAVFERRHEIYRAQIREFDRLVDGWLDGLDPAVRDRALVVVTGDHGQLFGEEGELGHQTSLHPAGVRVPLAVLPPAGWARPRTVERPVSWVGLSRALRGVVEGAVTDTDGLVEATVAGSRDEAGRVVVCADGPTWDPTALRGAYPDEAVDRVRVRRVGIVRRGTTTVYESGWDESTARRHEYETRVGSRTRRASTDAAEAPAPYDDWLAAGGERGVDAATSERLRRLGYL